MLVEKTNMLITNVNPRKEGKGDGMVLASDIKVEFEVMRPFIDRLVPDQEHKFSDQFFTDNGDVRLVHLYPIIVYQELKSMRVLIYMGKKPLEFMPAKVKGITLEPLSGGYVRVNCTLQVYPTAIDSGKLDSIAKEVVQISIEAATGDFDDAGPEATDSE